MYSAILEFAAIRILMRHWDGELSLAKSCWLSVAIWISLQIALQISGVANGATLGPSSLFLLVGFQFVILFWLVVGLWRAAERYQGPRFWSNLVRMAVILFAALNVTAFTQALSQPLTPVSIKMKPTILYSTSALLLLGSLALRNVITDLRWRVFALHFAILFFALAAANELIWRTFSTTTWVATRVWVTFPVFVLFALVETIIFKRRQDQLDGAQHMLGRDGG
jgi:intracellular septation protein